MPESEHGPRPHSGDAQIHIQRAAGLWAQAREARSSATRIEFERLALLYERLAVRAARREPQRSTLGDLLYADKGKPRVAEAAWVALVRRVVQRDPHGLRTLYLWTHRLVLTLLARLSNDWCTAEQLTVDVFCDLWLRAETFDAMSDSVIGWVMKRARSRALDGLQHTGKRAKPATTEPPFTTPVADLIFDWPTTVLPFSASLWKRIVGRIAVDARSQALLNLYGREREPDWEQPASGIHCKLLATGGKRGRVSLLVRLTPGIQYPPHTHTGVDELHLLQGELWIERRKLRPGDYIRAEPGTADQRVWSETGCTCLLITSSRDIFRPPKMVLEARSASAD